MSPLSYSKNTGFSGELRFKSSSDAVAIASSRSGSGGTVVGSGAGAGGAGGRVDVPEGPAGGDGIGRATGGLFLWQPATKSAARIRAGTADLRIMKFLIDSGRWTSWA